MIVTAAVTVTATAKPAVPNLTVQAAVILPVLHVLVCRHLNRRHHGAVARAEIRKVERLRGHLIRMMMTKLGVLALGLMRQEIRL